MTRARAALAGAALAVVVLAAGLLAEPRALWYLTRAVQALGDLWR